MTNCKNSINEKYILAIAYSDLGMGERKTSRSSGTKGGWCVTPKSRPNDLNTFARWLVSSKRGLEQFRQANTDISTRNPKTVSHGFDEVR